MYVCGGLGGVERWLGIVIFFQEPGCKSGTFKVRSFSCQALP